MRGEELYNRQAGFMKQGHRMNNHSPWGPVRSAVLRLHAPHYWLTVQFCYPKRAHDEGTERWDQGTC